MTDHKTREMAWNRLSGIILINHSRFFSDGERKKIIDHDILCLIVRFDTLRRDTLKGPYWHDAIFCSKTVVHKRGLTKSQWNVKEDGYIGSMRLLRESRCYSWSWLKAVHL